VLLAVGVVYVTSGFVLAVTGEIPQDLHRRWIENAYFVRRVSSFDVWQGSTPMLPEVGRAHAGGYPPWSMAVGLLAVPPFAEHVVRWYFACLNAVALAFVAHRAYGMGRAFGTPAARLLAASVLAVASNVITLRHGQYGILTNALLTLMLGALAAKRPAMGGAWLALASLKPQTAGPFAFAFLRRGDPIGWLVAFAHVVATTAFFSLWLDRSPVRLVSQVFGQAAEWEGGDGGILRLLLEAHVPRGPAVLALMAVSMILAGALAFRYRYHSLLVRAAMLSVAGRLWTYHRRYDDLMLVFLLLALGESALRRRTGVAWAAFLAVGLTLWLPFRENDNGLLLILVKVSIWILALIELLRHSQPEAAVSRSG
jgi:hypothetical protein